MKIKYKIEPRYDRGEDCVVYSILKKSFFFWYSTGICYMGDLNEVLEYIKNLNESEYT
jgi:hypothetical protein